MIWRWVLCLLLLPTVLWAVEAAAPEKDAPGYEGETKKVVEGALVRYQAARTYQDRCVIRFEVEGSEELPRYEPDELTLAWARPGRIALESPAHKVFCDGKTLWEYLVMLEQYLATPAPKVLMLDELSVNRFNMVQQFRHPVAMAVTGKSTTYRDLFGKVVSFSGTKAEVWERQLGKRVQGRVAIPAANGKGEDELPFSAWFSDKTGVLGEIRFDHTDLARRSVAEANRTDLEIKKYIQVFHFDRIRLDEKLPPERFVFKPGPFDEKRTEYRMPANAEEWQQKLVGRPITPFKAKDFKGQDFSSDALKGRVVLLDFWAVRCGPCIMFMPTLQKLSERYADKPVTFLGINGDEGSKLQGAKDRIKRLEITYRQLDDGPGVIFQAFRVQPIPCIVLLDKKGVIQSIHAGLVPNEDQILIREIDALLEGKPLFTPRKAAVGR